MNLGLRTLLFIAAIVCFIIAIFSDVHWPDWIAIGLICSVGAVLVAELGWDRRVGTGMTNRT
jgi:uncharacterized membrane protein YjjB (DUF3815 family)